MTLGALFHTFAPGSGPVPGESAAFLDIRNRILSVLPSDEGSSLAEVAQKLPDIAVGDILDAIWSLKSLGLAEYLESGKVRRSAVAARLLPLPEPGAV